MQNSFRKSVQHGVLWGLIGKVSQQASQFILSALLARLLAPSDYGLLATAMVFTGFAATISEAGIGTALVQKQELEDTHKNTAFWTTSLIGTAMTIAVYAAAPWIAGYYNSPQLSPILRTLSLNFTLGAVGSVPAALLQRQKQFKRIAIIDLASLCGGGAIALLLAYRHSGVWSLVAQLSAASLSTCVLRIAFIQWRPRIDFSGAALADISRFSLSLYGFNILNYWSRNLDNLLVGKAFGNSALGAYNRAYSLMLLPVTQVSSLLTQSLFPCFAQIQDDKPRVAKLYLKALSILTTVTYPMMFGLSTVSEHFVAVLYGPKWASAAPVLKILSLVGLLQVTTNTTGWLFLSQGKTGLLLRWGTFCSVLTITAIVIGIRMGTLTSLATCYSIATLLYFYPVLQIAAQTVGLDAVEIIRTIAPQFTISAAMAALVILLQVMLPATLHPVIALSISVFVGVSFYSGLLALFKPPAFHAIRELVTR